MGMIADFVASSVSIDKNPPTTALDNVVNRELNDMIARGDIESPGASYNAVNEVQSLAASGASAGTFAITVGVYDAGAKLVRQIPVTGIAYNAAPAAIQTAVDAAVDAVVAAYTNGDITVAGAGTADANPTTFTYDGTSVAGLSHPLSTVDGTGLTGGGSEAFSQTTDGQTARTAWAIMNVFSLVGFGGTPPAQGGSLPTLTKTIDKSVQRSFSDETLRTIAEEAEIQDRITGLAAALKVAFGVE